MAEPTESTAIAESADGNPPGTDASVPSEPVGQSSGTPVSEGTATATPSGTEAGTPEETFFDPKNLAPDLLPAYKQMQRDYVRKTQALSEQRQKVDAYDEFMRDPQGALRQLAAQYGMQFTPIGHQSQASPGNGLDDWQPQNWNEVLTKAKELAKEELMATNQAQLAPLIDEFKNIKKSQLEHQLDEEFPMWRSYEDEMKATLARHPSLVGDAQALIRAAIPNDVWQAKATQDAMQRLQAKSASAEMSSGSTTRRQPPDKPTGPLSFNDAVNLARKQIAAGQGIMGGKG